MKKFIAILLCCIFAISLVACGGETEESSTATFTASSKADEDSKSESSEATSSEVEDSSVAESSADVSDTSEDTSEDTSDVSGNESSEDPGTTEPVSLINKFVSWKIPETNGARTDIKVTDATSLQLTNFNEALSDGDTAVFTREYGKNLKADLSNYAVYVAVYDKEKYGYFKTDSYEVGKAPSSVAIPADGFVVVVWKDSTDKISAISATQNPLFPHGFSCTTGLDAKISSTKTAPTLDGVITEKEWGEVVWDVKPSNTLTSYAQFDKNAYDSLAKVYMTYDAEYLYLGVVVDTPRHENPVTSATASSMWKYTCIQVNVASLDRDTDYMKAHWDHANDAGTAAKANVIRQYGYGVSDDGESVACLWMGDTTKLPETFKVVRDEGAQTTTYECAIKWSDLSTEDGEAFAPKKGAKLGVAVSFNLGGPSSEFKNITLRDGGGIIGINDWSKTPTITLG